MKIDLELDNSKTYVLGCSFGPDSMALLHACLQNKIKVIVAHVNYHHRDESNYEEQALKKYCNDRCVPIRVLDLKNEKVEGNFEAWARKARYEFFAKVVKEENADGVLIAHHQDDLIETYLMQKQRKSYVKTWGIAKKTVICGAIILRPLLSFTKTELVSYCNENGTPYSIDKTNLENALTRNKIRHEIIEKLTPETRKKILEEIRNKPTTKTNYKPIMLVSEFAKLNYEEAVSLIDDFMQKHAEHRNISKSHYLTLLKTVQSSKTNLEIKLTNFLSIFKHENTLYFVDKNLLKKYSIILTKPGCFSDYIFEGDFSQANIDRNINENDYPITIKNMNPKDRVKINNYEVEVRRLFIDWKMPLFLREVWPGVYNKDNKLIYTPRYREKFTDNHISKFFIKIDELLN